MKVVSTEALTKLIQLVKSAFIKVDDVVEVSEIETETPSEITLATVATSGSYDDLSDKPTIPAAQVNSDWDATSGVAQILNKPTIPTVNNPTITFTQGGTTKGTITLNQASNQTIEFDAGGGARNIGQIIQSTIPLEDAGLHLLDGSVIQGNGIYSDFVDFIKNLHQQDPNGSWITDENGWQASVTQYGVCGKFAIDYPNNTVRLPKITGFIEGTTDVTALGDLVQAGLPNITGNVAKVLACNTGSQWSAVEAGTGAFSGTSSVSPNKTATGNGGWWSDTRTLNFNASDSSSIYGNSSTVQPQSIKVLYYIVIATSAKTDIQVDIDEIATDLNGKADVDFTNCNYIPMRSDVVHIVETYVNGTSWYRVYSDGWCEQGGRATISSYYANITFLKQFVDTNYNIGFAQNGFSEDTYCANVNNFTNSTMQLRFRGGGTFCFWQACGYI